MRLNAVARVLRPVVALLAAACGGSADAPPDATPPCRGESVIGPASPTEFRVVRVEPAWTGEANALAFDGAEASVDLEAEQVSRLLVVSGFGFQLPSDATLTGVTVEVSQAATGVVETQFIGFWATDFSTGNNVWGMSAPWLGDPAFRAYGDGMDLWGQGSGFDASVANDAALALAIAVRSRDPGPARARIDDVRVTIDYMDGGVSLSEGPRSGTSAAQLPFLRAWSDLDRAGTEDDVSARIEAMTHNEVSERFVASGFGFRLPDDATVTGIQLDVRKRSSGNVDDDVVELVRGGQVLATNRAVRFSWWPQAFEDFTYGGPGDLWDESWTAADVNDPAFGAALAATYRVVSGNGSAELDHLALTIYAICP